MPLSSGLFIDISSSQESWVRHNNAFVVSDETGDDNEKPDFSWVNLDSNTIQAQGFETSAIYSTGSSIEIHTNIFNGEEVQTVSWFLYVGPNAVSSVYLSASSNKISSLTLMPIGIEVPIFTLLVIWIT